ncbi:MAG: hypothetical protein H6Q75_525 [Firmicutes bacterium]|nr:hypothetical protein [Bacillota bacterium]
MEHLELVTTLLLLAASFSAGFIDSISGGGGLLLMPALLVAGLPPQMTLGTNKFASFFGTGIAFANFIYNKKVVWSIAAVGLPFSLLGTYLGAKSILLFSNDTIGKIIVFLLPLAMVVTLLPRQNQVLTPNRRSLFLKTPLVCLLLGFYDGFFGPGTGSFLILALYSLLGIGLVEASATAKAFNLASNLGALLVFFLDGKVLVLLGLPLAAANIAGNYFGSRLVLSGGVNVVKRCLLVSFTLLIISLFMKYFIFQ